MNDTAIESFITFCDDMIIAEESMRLKEFYKVKKDNMKKIKELEKKANSDNISINERIRIYKSLLKIADNAIQTVNNMQPDNWDRFFNVLGWLGFISGTTAKMFIGRQQKQDSFNNTTIKNMYKNDKFGLKGKNEIFDPESNKLLDDNDRALAKLKNDYTKVSIKYLIIYASAWGVSFVGKKNTIHDKKKTKDQLLSTFSKKYIHYDAEIKRLEKLK